MAFPHRLQRRTEALRHPAAGVQVSCREDAPALPHYCCAAADSRKKRQEDVDYLELCRRKRNITEYEHTGAATEADAVELTSSPRGRDQVAQAASPEPRTELIHKGSAGQCGNQKPARRLRVLNAASPERNGCTHVWGCS